jgi:dihydrofolate synthase/folylpolyglutamate synthase
MGGMDMPQTLDEWLAYCERLHPQGIEMGLERVRAVALRMQLKFDCPVITVAGTNGKGSTCAMLESILAQAGYRVGLYTSPHLVDFQERCRLRGQAVRTDVLLTHFQAVERARRGSDMRYLPGRPQDVRGEVALTYFEFTTLAIFSAMAHTPLDVVILEVGMGGRLDAVNLIDTDCAIITSIDLDHMEFLGPDRESIGREKAGIIRSGKPVIVSDPAPPQSVLKAARLLDADLWQLGSDFQFAGDKQQWNWSGRGKRYSALAYPALRGANQLLNAAGALAALTALWERLPVTAQAVRNGLALVEWPGRFQIVPGQPALVLDVAHNPHSVAALAENLDAMGFYPRTHAVLGAMADKDLPSMLARIGPLIDCWYFCDLPTPRAARAEDLRAQWQAAAGSKVGSCSTHPGPRQALERALSEADPADRIIVFGSFFTIGGVLRGGLPRFPAPHRAG